MMSAKVPAIPPEIMLMDKSGRFSIMTMDSILGKNIPQTHNKV